MRNVRVFIRHHKFDADLSQKIEMYMQNTPGMTKVDFINGAAQLMVSSTPNVNRFLIELGKAASKVFNDEKDIDKVLA